MGNASTLVSDALLAHIFYLIELCLVVGAPEQDQEAEPASKSANPALPNLAMNIGIQFHPRFLYFRRLGTSTHQNDPFIFRSGEGSSWVEVHNIS
jgi:hypothetical protein